MRLQNQEIWLAFPKLTELYKIRLPVETSLGIARLLSKLQQSYAIIEGERVKLIYHYGVENKEAKQVTVELDSPNAGDFALEFGELLTLEWGEDVQFEKIKLPEKIETSIDPQILLPLLEKFVEM